MWILTREGFYSIVDHSRGDTDELTIRARDQADLERLRASLPEMGEITTDPRHDYQHRARAPRKATCRAIADLVGGIDYGNFKKAVTASPTASRHTILHRVWATLLDIGRNYLYPNPCQRCGGWGKVDTCIQGLETCPACLGSGEDPIGQYLEPGTMDFFDDYHYESEHRGSRRVDSLEEMDPDVLDRIEAAGHDPMDIEPMGL